MAQKFLIVLAVLIAAVVFAEGTRHTPPVPQSPTPTQVVPGGNSNPSITPTSRPGTKKTPEVFVPTQTNDPVIPIPTIPVPVTGQPEGTVNTDMLNLRAGPGIQYRIIAQLPLGQNLSLVGRSYNGEWIEVHLPDGAGGWVSSGYVTTNYQLAQLPVHEAQGGPLVPPQNPTDVSAQPPADYQLNMTISGSQAAVTISGFPSNEDLLVRLGVNGTAHWIHAATGRTAGDGSAVITFTMPSTWLDGKPVSETTMTLEVGTLDGSTLRRATITYVH